MTNFDRHIKKELENLNQNYVPDDWLAMETLLRETAFDQFINQKIESHEEIITPEDLQQFDKFLNAKAFDNFVQHKFELIEAAEMESDWESFESNLDAQTFDKTISQKMETLETSLAITDWEIFEQKLSEKNFDTLVKEKIETYSTTYRKSDWYKMRNLLAKLNPQQSYIWDATKRFLPILLLFLFIGSAFYWLKNIGESEKPIPITSKQKLPISSPQGKMKSNENLDKQILEDEKVIAKKEGNKKPKSAQKEVNVKPENLEINTVAFVKTEAEELFVKTEKIAQEAQTMAENKISEQTKPLMMQEASLKENIVPFSSQQVIQKEKAVINLSSNIVIQKSDYHAININANLTEKNLNYQLKNVSFNNWNPQFSMGLYTAPLWSLVELNDTVQIGAAMGLRTELNLNEKWSLTTDVLYSKRNFETQYYKIYRPSGAYLQHLLIGKITSIDIPIMIKHQWNLDKKGNWGIYMQAGAVPTISLDEDYTHYDPTTIENIGKNWDGNLRKMAPVKQAFHFRPYMGNVIVAPGLQYNIGQLHIQAEPRFQWAIQAMSVENKRLHSLGLGISAVYSFGKK